MRISKFIFSILYLFLCSLGISAQSSSVVVDDDCLVKFFGNYYRLTSHLDIPEGANIQKYLSKLIFGDTDHGVKEAYDIFLKNWKREDLDSKKALRGSINIKIVKEYELPGRFASYHVTAYVKGSARFDGLPQTSDVEEIKSQYYLFKKGVDKGFIIDIQNNRIAGVNQVFVPSVAVGLKNMFGNDFSLYAEDRCVQIYSGPNDGRIIFSETSEKNFTDYFKQLVGWGQQTNCDSPRFFRGESGMLKYFRDNNYYIVSKEEAADTALISMIINEDGTHIQPKIVTSTKDLSGNRLLELCEKMPKWMPAYQDGKPITKEAFFTIRFPSAVYDIVEQMPSYPGGMGALMQFLSSNVKYPVEAEENGIMGRVICTFVVERDGSITDVKVAKSVHPLLDREAVRVISRMPNWNPGMLLGEPVRVKYTLPVIFRLE